MGQLSWVLQGAGETTALWKAREGRGAQSKALIITNAFLECCHHPLAGCRTAPAALLSRRSLFLSREVTGQLPSLLLPVSLPARGQTGKLMKPLWPNLSFYQYMLEPLHFQSQPKHSNCNENIKIIKMKMKWLCYDSGLKLSGLLSGYDSYTWRLWQVHTEGGIFKCTIDVTWLLPKANSFQLTNNHCPANMSSWVIILPLYQETAWVKKP